MSPYLEVRGRGCVQKHHPKPTSLLWRCFLVLAPAFSQTSSTASSVSRLLSKAPLTALPREKEAIRCTTDQAPTICGPASSSAVALAVRPRLQVAPTCVKYVGSQNPN